MKLSGSMFHFWCPVPIFSPDYCNTQTYRETYRCHVSILVPRNRPSPDYCNTQTYRETYREAASVASSVHLALPSLANVEKVFHLLRVAQHRYRLKVLGTQPCVDHLRLPVPVLIRCTRNTALLGPPPPLLIRFDIHVTFGSLLS
jgi:hypothetical protein